ncbi:hypothetical protein B4N89_34465 [Embleya scabrispora]|uniref:Uncharacterized protein n=1 Tax=Embleya scabrispora TaxID=159449 RepID=A0A1T3NQV8_9ACTN|nr:hypothetical protein [Embleya scabrispora]OPC79178.1 hypothetical protein B4N89_34465 [Embleya scabrispora]
MPNDDGYEPVFRRSRLGGGRYVYNLHNPVGRVLAVLASTVTGVFMLLMATHTGLFADSPARPEPTLPRSGSYAPTPAP